VALDWSETVELARELASFGAAFTAVARK
jgi:hypothetical protein